MTKHDTLRGTGSRPDPNRRPDRPLPFPSSRPSASEWRELSSIYPTGTRSSAPGFLHSAVLRTAPVGMTGEGEEGGDHDIS